MPAEELESIKTQYMTSFRDLFESPQDLADSLMVHAMAGFPVDYHVSYEQRVRAYTREEISAASGLLNITRQIAGMGGIALAGVLLERWHYVHHLTGAEHLDLPTVGVEQIQGRLAWILQDGGDVGEVLHTKVQAVLSQYLTQESLVVAFQDCYVVFTVVFVVAALASACIPGGEEKQ